MLVDHGADLLIHLGDIGSAEVIDALALNKPGSNEQMPAYMVFGNTDWDIDSLTSYAQEIGIGVSHPVGRLATPRGDLVYLHGDDQGAVIAALEDKVAYLCHGHTHIQADTRRGATRVINPGALHRASQYTVAMLNTDNDSLTFYAVA